MSGKHGKALRGLSAKALAEAPGQGRFGKMFPKLKAATYGNTDNEQLEKLTKLANAMVSEFDPPKDGPDDEESGIPALYTYFGQFVDHDLTFDPTASFQKVKDPEAK